MKLGIMQPYFVPYLGYWQLMNAVDKYVVYDDVNFIKGGWINRNRILLNGHPQYFNIPMLGASPNKLINGVRVNNDPRLKEKNMRILEAAYKKAPFYADVYPLVEKIINFQAETIASYIINSFEIINKYLSINTELIISSTLKKNNSLHAQDKVLEICKLLGANEYYNAIGGRALYSFDDFQAQGISLFFLKSGNIQYKQFDKDFQADLSIIDVMMFNHKEKIKQYLLQYSLISREEI